MADKPQGAGGADETLPELTPSGADETFPELTPTGAAETFPELAAPEETLAGGAAAPGANETFIDEGEGGAGSTVTSPLTTQPPSEPETFIEEEVPSPATGGDTTGSTIVSGGDIIEEMTQSGQAVAVPAQAAVAQPGAEFLPMERKRPKSDVWTLFLVFAFVIFCGGIYLTGKELYDLYDVKFGILSKEGEIPPQEEGAAAQKPAEEAKKEPAAKEEDKKGKEGEQKPADGDQKKPDEEKKPADGQGEKKDGDGGWPGEPKKNE